MKIVMSILAMVLLVGCEQEVNVSEGSSTPIMTIETTPTPAAEIGASG